MMNRQSPLQYKDRLQQLKKAENELKELNQQLQSFEALVDSQLGSLLDQLSDLNGETADLDARLRLIREERLFGTDLMHYQAGAPTPTRLPDLSDLPPMGLSSREAIHSKADGSFTSKPIVPDIKSLYRKLARRYHPDLARSEADRAVSNQQMAEINRAYNAGDLKGLMRLAGIGLPYGVELPGTSTEDALHRKETMSELEWTEMKLKEVSQQITRMSSLPIVKLSLEVKLARHQGRNLLLELAADLRAKVGRKLAERDYLQAQINAHNAKNEY